MYLVKIMNEDLVRFYHLKLTGTCAYMAVPFLDTIIKSFYESVPLSAVLLFP